jgi:hypothetical protein
MGVTFLEQLTKMRPNCARAWTWHNQLAPANNEQHSTAHALCPPLCSCYITEKNKWNISSPHRVFDEEKDKSPYASKY